MTIFTRMPHAFRILSRILPGLAVGLLTISLRAQDPEGTVVSSSPTPAANANAGLENSGEELRLIRQLLENQSKQIESLTLEVSRLRAEVEAQIPKAVAANPPASPSLPNNALPAPQPPDLAAESMPPAPNPADSPNYPGTPPAGPTYVVKAGETLTSIAKQFDTTVAKLMELNSITDGRKLQIGQSLVLPAPEPQTPQETP